MGGKTTKLFRSSAQTDSNPSDDEEQLNNMVEQRSAMAQAAVDNTKSPFVHYRRGSMYIDEDGDVAHEFYVETKVGSKVTLKQISNQHLTPQGNIPLEVPCLRSDYPIILLSNREKE